MKKVISLILIAVLLIAVSANVYAAGVLPDGNGATQIPKDEYDNAQKDDEDDTDKGTSDEDASLPQTGVEDFGLGVILVVCVASAIFAYKKVSDYRGV